MSNKAAGERLRTAREQAGLSQAELGVDSKTVRKAENGQRVGIKSMRTMDEVLAHKLGESAYRHGEIYEWFREVAAVLETPRPGTEEDGPTRPRGHTLRWILLVAGCGVVGLVSGWTLSARAFSPNARSVLFTRPSTLNPELTNARIVGPVDVDKACAEQQAPPYEGPAVVIAPADAFSWKCSAEWEQNGSLQKGVDMYSACKEQYGRANLEARPIFLDRPEWVCVERK